MLILFFRTFRTPNYFDYSLPTFSVSPQTASETGTLFSETNKLFFSKFYRFSLVFLGIFLACVGPLTYRVGGLVVLRFNGVCVGKLNYEFWFQLSFFPSQKFLVKDKNNGLWDDSIEKLRENSEQYENIKNSIFTFCKSCTREKLKHFTISSAIRLNLFVHRISVKLVFARWKNSLF